MNMIDTADAYGNGHNETLVGRAIAGKREQAFVATKFGIVFDEFGQGVRIETTLGNFGVAIILLTVIVRGIMFPVAQRQFASMASMLSSMLT